MRALTWLAVGVGAAGLAALLWAEARGRAGGRALPKMVASAGFVVLALARGGEPPYATLVLGGLVLSALGDAMLLSEARGPFLAGLVAFLLAHLAYAVAFAPVSAPSAWALAAVVAAAALVLRWLWPRLGPMRLPVVAYCAVISAMLWLALGTGQPAVAAGGLLFYLSDLFVARHRFVRASAWNRLLGLPLYYAGQYLIAFSAG